MRFLSLFTSRALFASALILFAASAAATAQDAAKDKPKQDGPKVSEAEAKMAQKINQAPDPAAKLTAAEEFLKKYPKSPLRPQIVDLLAAQVTSVSDNTQKITLSERYMALFPAAGEGDRVAPYLVAAYIDAKRFDDAFRAGAAWLAKHPDDVRVLAPLSHAAVEQAQAGNRNFLPHATPYGTKAIEALEAGTKPADMDDAEYKRFKESWLPQLYQTQGFLALISGDAASALAKGKKAVELKPADPINYFIVGSALDDEYRKMAAQYQSMPAGPQKTEMMTKINAQLDQIIDNYARAVALSEGSPQHKAVHDQVLQDMTSYYKYRKGSTEGMQALIDKYKKPAPTQP